MVLYVILKVIYILSNVKSICWNGYIKNNVKVKFLEDIFYDIYKDRLFNRIKYF